MESINLSLMSDLSNTFATNIKKNLLNFQKGNIVD